MIHRHCVTVLTLISIETRHSDVEKTFFIETCIFGSLCPLCSSRQRLALLIVFADEKSLPHNCSLIFCMHKDELTNIPVCLY